MKIAIICSALVIGLAAPLAAQTDAAPATVAAMTGISIDTPIEQILANPAGKAVLDTEFPGLAAHPAYEQFKAMSLKQLQPYSNGVITDEKLTKATADLAAVK